MKTASLIVEPLPLKWIRNLEVSAASGLLLVNDNFYVVADDELSLRWFSRSPNSAMQSLALLAGSLPEEKKSRKKLKPDFESLLGLDNNKMLALPSGSKPNRVRAALISESAVEEVDCSLLFEFLRFKIPELNIEGAVNGGDKIWLFQRGNGENSQNGIISLNSKIFCNEVKISASLSEKSFLDYSEIKLLELNGHPLSFTDAAVESVDRVWALAAAESGKSTYEDGIYLGSILICMNSKFQILFQQRLDCPTKPEGLALDLLRKKFYLVTDADDRALPSQLFEGDLPQF